MKNFIALLFILAGVIIIWVTRESNDSSQDGQAGSAYIENEDGELVLLDGDRHNERTVVPGGEKEGDWLTSWELTERSGKSLGSKELIGQPYVAGFFFSTCPTICVQQNGRFRELQDKFKGQEIRFVSISCDPEVDNPETLTEYAKRFEADEDQWLFFTGEMDYIRNVGFDIFRLGVVRRGHPEKFALMDAEGKRFGLYTWSEEGQWQALQNDIARMIEAGGVLEGGVSSVEKQESLSSGTEDLEERADSAGDAGDGQ